MADQPVWNPSDKDADVTLSDSNRTWMQNAGTVGSVRSTVALSSGKWRVQLLHITSAGSANRHGFATASHSISVAPGEDTTSWAINGQGDSESNGTTVSLGGNYGNGAVVNLYIDIAAGKIWYGDSTGPFSGDPAAGTGAHHTFTGGTSIYLCDGMNGGGSNRGGTLRLLADYTGSAPSGFTDGWGGSAPAITGTVSITEAGDGVSAAGALRLAGAASITEAGDSLSSAGALHIRAAATVTLDNDSVTAVIGITPVLADGAITEADDSISASGVLPITGSASITGDDDSLTGAGALFILATGSALEDDDSVASAAALLIQGGAAIDEGADLISAEGALLIVGAANIVEDDDSVVANDFVPRGRLDILEDPDFLRATGGTPPEWFTQEATRHDYANWNQCPRCARKVRPNKMHQQMEYRGPRLVWTGLYVCSSCLDDPQQQGIWPRETGGDPRPVILARPRRD